MTPQKLEQIRGNRRIRQRLAFEHPLWFSLLYLQHHFPYSFAPFHMEMFHLIQDSEYKLVVVMAFRESGKSTIMNMVNVLWSILGRPGRKFVIIMSDTQEQAKNHFFNIKSELQSNELLIEDFGPFMETKDEWNKMSLELVHHESKILSIDRNQNVRGLKYGSFRPDLIICDDLEDTISAANARERENLYEKFQGEFIPVGSEGTKIIVLGNLLSDKSLIMRLKTEIEEDKIPGTFRAYPFSDDNGKLLWPQKFKDSETVLTEKVSDETWAREYMLSLCESRRISRKSNTPDPPKGWREELDQKFLKESEELENRYRHLWNRKTQKPLINQMEGFEISAPTKFEVIEPDRDDPLLGDYLRYQEELEALEVAQSDEFMRNFQADLARRMGSSPENIEFILSGKKLTWAECLESREEGTDQSQQEIHSGSPATQQFINSSEEKMLSRYLETGFYDPEFEKEVERLKENCEGRSAEKYQQQYEELLRKHLRKTRDT